MSEKRITPSTPYARKGWREISSAASGISDRSRNVGYFATRSLYTFMWRPACRIIQTGVRSTFSPRAALNSSGSCSVAAAAACRTVAGRGLAAGPPGLSCKSRRRARRALSFAQPSSPGGLCSASLTFQRALRQPLIWPKGLQSCHCYRSRVQNRRTRMATSGWFCRSSADRIQLAYTRWSRAFSALALRASP